MSRRLRWRSGRASRGPRAERHPAGRVEGGHAMLVLKRVPPTPHFIFRLFNLFSIGSTFPQFKCKRPKSAYNEAILVPSPGSGTRGSPNPSTHTHAESQDTQTHRHTPPCPFPASIARLLFDVSTERACVTPHTPSPKCPVESY